MGAAAAAAAVGAAKRTKLWRPFDTSDDDEEEEEVCPSVCALKSGRDQEKLGAAAGVAAQPGRGVEPATLAVLYAIPGAAGAPPSAAGTPAAVAARRGRRQRG